MPRPGELLHVALGDVGAGEALDERADDLAVLRVGHAHDLDVLDAGHRVEELLDLARVDVLPAADDHVLDAPGDAVVAVLVDGAQVARVQPAVGVDGRLGGLGHLVVALHDVVAAAQQLAGDARRAVLAGLGVDDAHLDLVVPAAHRLALALERVVRRGLREHRGRLGEAVADGHLGRVHLVDDLPHRLDRARRAGHDAGAQAT